MRRFLVISIGIAVGATLIWVISIDRNTEAPREDARASAPAEDTDQSPKQQPVLADDTFDSSRVSEFEELFDPPEFEISEFDQLPKLGATWAKTQSQLHADAKAGDPVAQFGLYLANYRCYIAPKSQSDLDARTTSVANAYSSETRSYNSTPPNASRLIASMENTYEFCSDSESDKLSEFVYWLESSADQGYLPALLKYGVNYPGDDELDPADESDQAVIEERTKRSREYFEQAKAAGSIDAIGRLVGMYQRSNEQESEKEALANLYAYAWYRKKYSNSDFLLEKLRQEAFGLSPFEFVQVVTAGRSILESDQCCVKVSGID